MKVECYYSVTNWFFLIKYIVKCSMEVCESWIPCFSCRSQLLSTTILNDIENTYVCSSMYFLGQVLNKYHSISVK